MQIYNPASSVIQSLSGNSPSPIIDTTFARDNQSYQDYYSQMSDYFKGTKYEDVFNSNPYANNQINPNFWDKVVNFFGGRSSADKYNQDMENSSREYISQLVNLAREEKYNSALEQVQRQREAGLNPDLNGGVTSGDATEFDDQSINPPETPSDGLSLGTVLQNFLSAFDVATDMTKKIFDIQSMSKDIDNKDLQNTSVLSSLADVISQDVNGGVYNPDVVFQMTPDGNEINWFDSKSGEFVFPFPSIRMSKRNLSRFYPMLQQRYNSLKSRNSSMKTKDEYLKSAQGVAIKEGSRFFAGLNDGPDVWKRSLHSLSNLLDRSLTSSITREMFDNNYHATYYSLLNPSNIAGAENSEAAQRKEMAYLMKDYYSGYQSIIHDIAETSKNGSGFEQFFSKALLFVLPMLNGISFSGGSNSATGKFGTSKGRHFSASTSRLF